MATIIILTTKLLCSNPSCVPLTRRKLLVSKIGGTQFSNVDFMVHNLVLYVAKEPPEKFSRKKLAEFCHDVTGML